MHVRNLPKVHAQLVTSSGLEGGKITTPTPRMIAASVQALHTAGSGMTRTRSVPTKLYHTRAACELLVRSAASSHQMDDETALSQQGLLTLTLVL